MSSDTAHRTRSTHGAILGVDMEGYARPDRNDADRVHLRDVLWAILRIKEHLGDALERERLYYGLLAARITLLHLRINVGTHAFIECTPGRDQDSPYHYEHLLRHVAILSGVAGRERFGIPLVARLRALPCWPAFADRHLRVIGDLHARRLGGLPRNDAERDERFADSCHCPELEPIAAAVQELWR
jgi:hypothetical protein